MYLSAWLYNTTPPNTSLTSPKVGKKAPSLRLPWSPSFLRTHLAQTSDLIRFPAAPEGRLHTLLDQLSHSLTLRAGSMLLGIPRSALRGRSPSGLHLDLLPQWTSSVDVEGWRGVYIALQEPESCAQSVISVNLAMPALLCRAHQILANSGLRITSLCTNILTIPTATTFWSLVTVSGTCGMTKLIRICDQSLRVHPPSSTITAI